MFCAVHVTPRDRVFRKCCQRVTIHSSCVGDLVLSISRVMRHRPRSLCQALFLGVVVILSCVSQQVFCAPSTPGAMVL